MRGHRPAAELHGGCWPAALGLYAQGMDCSIAVAGSGRPVPQPCCCRCPKPSPPLFNHPTTACRPPCSSSAPPSLRPSTRWATCCRSAGRSGERPSRQRQDQQMARSGPSDFVGAVCSSSMNAASLAPPMPMQHHVSDGPSQPAQAHVLPPALVSACARPLLLVRPSAPLPIFFAGLLIVCHPAGCLHASTWWRSYSHSYRQLFFIRCAALGSSACIRQGLPRSQVSLRLRQGSSMTAMHPAAHPPCCHAASPLALPPSRAGHPVHPVHRRASLRICMVLRQLHPLWPVDDQAHAGAERQRRR